MDKAAEVQPATTVVVVTGGEPPDPAVRATLPADARVVAADSGASVAELLGLVVHEVVGDLDSLSPAEVQRLVELGASLEAHEPDKDATDLELALTVAMRHDPTHIIVLGGLGGRPDHELANLLLLSSEAMAGVDVALRSGRCTVCVIRPGRRTTLSGSRGEVVSLMAVSGPARGVTTTGLRWPLVDAELTVGTTLGISNELLGPQASVTCNQGVVLAVQPGMASAFVPPRSASPSNPEVFDDR